MNIFSAFKNLFGDKKPVETPTEPTKLPKSLLSEYRQNFSIYDSFHKNHRPHQIFSLNSLFNQTIGQISIPTGTGKTRIQVDVHISDMIEKTKNNETGVYVIAAHRLALCSQLLYDIVEIAIPCGLNFDVLQVNSNYFTNDAIRTKLRKSSIDENLRAFTNKVSNGANATNTSDVFDFVNKAKQNNRHVIIVATYHSFNKLSAISEIDICTYDEAHITLGEDFTSNIALVQPIILKNFFFTATRKVIGTSDGMNNTEKYGNVLYSVSPRNMIECGEIVSPRLHSIKISENAEDGNYDNTKMLVKTVTDGFTQHKQMIKSNSVSPNSIGAKLLISCSGSKELKEIINRQEFISWCKDNDVNMFSFSSDKEIGYKYNFETITRSEIFSKMDDLQDSEDAILLHIDILTEGIDLPSITGVMPLRNLNQSKLIQTIGRATRLLKQDRTNLYSGNILPSESEKFVKPYCWFLVPQIFDSLGDFNSMKRLLREIMNTYDMRPEEFSNHDSFIANFEIVLPKVTDTDTITKREKECDLKHVFEEIYLNEFQEKMNELSQEEKFSILKTALEQYNA